ncbi:MAG: type III-B CRISPR module RAMP protein Cmr1 [Armatimonadota bacterium]|nr:type III-B CRISPR module RAMP protein Cmr1 [Armatimonadota bacterium]MDR7502077.1 type III-B CRISPR module RAMP protein Cmr1 [Armatimonadota bacterium]MDR7585438.1 type III-B CRISPR module RAMP protein Cmr1 [Armatimonadota bacterium]
MDAAREWQLNALTPVWTGSVKIENDREKIVNEQVVPIGLLGSIRWWFEVLVRGLDGSACDPIDTKCRAKDHCVVCELFGCTGWARKFRFQVLAGADGDTIQREPLQMGNRFRLRFQPLREIAPEEWALLDLTLHLIADYGAIGGKTVLKPSDETSRASRPHHQDYGIIDLLKGPFEKDGFAAGVRRRELEAYVRNGQWCTVQHGDFAWASLRHFWCVNGKYLAREDADKSRFNRVIGREEQKARGQQIRNGQRRANEWLAGRQRESKKVFSFKSPARTFGFVKPGTVDFEAIKGRLRRAWPDLRDDEFLTGDEIIDRLLSGTTSS